MGAVARALAFVAAATTVPAMGVGGGAVPFAGSAPPPPLTATSSAKNESAKRNEGAAVTGSTVAPRTDVFGDGSGVAGVYVGVGRGFKLGATTGLEVGTVDRRLVLFSDGTSTAIIPPEGFDAVDLPWYKAKYPDSFNRWEQRGSRIVIQVGARTDTVRLDGQTLITEGDASPGQWVKVPTGTGRTLQGTYALHHWKPEDFADPKYFPYGMMRLGFAADGTFEDVGHVKTLYTAPLRLPFPGSAFFERLASPSKGRYRIANNTLYLTYLDGRELALAFWVAPGGGAGPSPSVIVIAGYALTLRP
jgi:hypothetical protein